MRKAALFGAAAAIALGVSAAKADVFVDGNINKYVEIDIREDVEIDKDVWIQVDLDTLARTAAESEAVFNQKNTDNFACENCAEKTDTIVNSVLDNTGITSVNQSSGNMNNQGTVISIAFFDASRTFTFPFGSGAGDPNKGDDPEEYSLADSQVVGEQKLTDNEVDSVQIVFRDAIIRNSVNDNVGVTAVNQSVGNVNNQANAVSIAVTPQFGVALSDVALGQYNAENSTVEESVQKEALVSGSVNNNAGITQVNQAAGVNANQSNIVSVATAGLN